MTSAVSKLVFKKILAESASNDQGRDDPYFETVPTQKMSYFTGKTSTKLKRRKKALPPGLSAAEEKTLIKVKRRAYRLDMALGTCCGIKLGWGSVIGIVPVIGDVIDTMLALMVIRTAAEANLPGQVLVHMLINVAFDFLLGLVPFLGDIADMAYKANTRNAILLENCLRKRGKASLKKQGKNVPEDLSLADHAIEETATVETREPNQQPGPSYQRDGDYDVEAQRPSGKSKKSKKSKHGNHSHRGGEQISGVTGH